MKCVEFSEGLERIGAAAFARSGVKNIVLPASTKAVGPQTFDGCEQLRSVRLNEGLRELGPEEYFNGKLKYGLVFSISAVEDITIPSTLKVTE